MSQKIKLNIDVDGVNEIKTQVGKLSELLSQVEVELDKLSEMKIVVNLGPAESGQQDFEKTHHNFIQKDTYWKSCTHCGMIAPLGQ